MAPLGGLLVVDLSRFVPGAYATRELLRLGARVVRLESPGGDPLRETAAVWHDALNGEKESVVCDLKAEPELGQALCARADVLVESFRPGVAERLGIGPTDLPESVVYCSITGFGDHDLRAGHDLNYEGWAGTLAETAPAMPPVQAADIAGGALVSVTEILAALLERARTGRGRRVVVSLTHGAHRLVADRPPGLLTGALACYRIYATADGRFLTVAPLERRFFARLCELIERPELAERQYGDDQERLSGELAAVFATRPLSEWLELFDGEDVCVGPVATVAEAAAEFGGEPPGRAPALGEHTEAWREELGL